MILLSDRGATEALDALRNRVRWYVTRAHQVPEHLALAFNELANALFMPDKGCWKRFKR